MSLRYTIRLVQEKSGSFFAEIEELPGCMAQGETVEEAIDNLKKSKRIWLQSMLQKRMIIPEPRGVVKYSGKFLMRMPAYLHKRLSSDAKKEGVSLNQYVLSLLVERSSLSVVESKVDNIVMKIEEQTKAYELLSRSWGKVSYPVPQKDVTTERDIPKKKKWLPTIMYQSGETYES